MTRKEQILSLVDVTGVGLEIGPSFSPLAPKADGYYVEILDHMSAAGLRKKYENANVDLSKIEEVDYVSDGGSILELIGKSNYYDYIIASHVIEHTVDLLGFILDCERLLNAQGVLVLAVPDKRFAFDCLRPCSTTGQILQAHLEKRVRHSAGQVFDEIAYNCLREDVIAWERNDSGSLAFLRQLHDAKEIFDTLKHQYAFHDIHAWQFSPSSFRLIMSDLAEIGEIGLREKSFSANTGGEYFMSLSKTASGCTVDRLLLAEHAISEQNEIIVRSAEKS